MVSVAQEKTDLSLRAVENVAPAVEPALSASEGSSPAGFLCAKTEPAAQEGRAGAFSWALVGRLSGPYSTRDDKVLWVWAAAAEKDGVP